MVLDPMVYHWAPGCSLSDVPSRYHVWSGGTARLVTVDYTAEHEGVPVAEAVEPVDCLGPDDPIVTVK